MYLLDNAAVREDWNAAKSIVVGTLEKHGGKVLTARRWGERRLAYPIKQKNRATFLLTYYEIPAENIPDMRRDFELNESVLRSDAPGRRPHRLRRRRGLRGRGRRPRSPPRTPR